MPERILLLNASSEPLCTVTLRRAMVLLLGSKAMTVAARESDLHSSTRVLENPSVIQLKNYVHVPYKGGVPLTRKALLARDNHTCQYCFKRGTTIDHVQPKAKGGKHKWENVVIACMKCNSKKTDKLLSELGWKLPKEPVAPSPSEWLGSALLAIDATWEPFLAGLN